MAAVMKAVACEYCGLSFAGLTKRGALTHTGICSVNVQGAPGDWEGSTPSQSEAEADLAHDDGGGSAVVSDEEEDEQAQIAAAPPPPEPTRHPFSSDADWDLVRLVSQRDSLPRGILDELLGIFGKGGLTFRTSYAVLTAIDALPGVPFNKMDLFLNHLPGVRHAELGTVQYTFFFRSIGALLVDGLKRCRAEDLRHPELFPDEQPIDHLVTGSWYQDTLRTLRACSGDDAAVLLPVVLHSGMCVRCWCEWVIHG